MPFGTEKLEWFGYSVVKKKLKICLFVLTECTNVTDGHTYRHTDNAWRHRPRLHSIARQEISHKHHEACQCYIDHTSCIDHTNIGRLSFGNQARTRLLRWPFRVQRHAVIVPHRIIWSWYTGRWWVGCYIWYSEEGPAGRAVAPPSPLLVVPNVTVHPSTASVPITVLSYNGRCRPTGWQLQKQHKFPDFTSRLLEQQAWDIHRRRLSAQVN